MRDPDWNQLAILNILELWTNTNYLKGNLWSEGTKTCELGATIGITDKMEAWPQPPLLVPQARTQDEGVGSCDSDLFFPFLG